MRLRRGCESEVVVERRSDWTCWAAGVVFVGEDGLVDGEDGDGAGGAEAVLEGMVVLGCAHCRGVEVTVRRGWWRWVCGREMREACRSLERTVEGVIDAMRLAPALRERLEDMARECGNVQRSSILSRFQG